MPRSQNRRYLEIPTALYLTLAEQAKAESRTIAQVAADLITDGQTVHEYLVEIQTQLREIRRELAELRESKPPSGFFDRVRAELAASGFDMSEGH